MRGLGTVVNLITVAVGGSVGVLIGHRFPAPMRRTIMQGLGLVTIAVAVTGFAPLLDADEGLKRAVIAIGSVIAGGIVGEALRLEDRLASVGDRLRERLGVTDGDSSTATDRSSFVEGFVVSSTVFCAGPMTILGAVEDGLGTSVRLLMIKSTLDGFAAIGFASIYGWGVLASLVTIALYQGLLTGLGVLIEPLLSEEVLAQIGVVGGVLVLGVALRLLELVEVRVINLVPALVFAGTAAGVVESLAR
ncbi:MAG: DUF554 domain-containing protein [Actinomycetota bacterium]